jgi:hypothetical protein
LAAPLLRFVDNGWLVAASSETIHVYRAAENYKIRWEVNHRHRHGDPLAILRTDCPDQFAIVVTDGTMVLYRISR